MRRRLFLAAAVFLLSTLLRILCPALFAGAENWWEDAAGRELRSAAASAGAFFAPERDGGVFPVSRWREAP